MSIDLAKARGFTVRDDGAAGWAVIFPRGGGTTSTRFPDSGAAWSAAARMTTTPDEGRVEVGHCIEVATMQTGGPVVHVGPYDEDGCAHFVVEFVGGGFYVLFGALQAYCDGSAEEGEAEASTLADALAILEKGRAAL